MSTTSPHQSIHTIKKNSYYLYLIGFYNNISRKRMKFNTLSSHQLLISTIIIIVIQTLFESTQSLSQTPNNKSTSISTSLEPTTRRNLFQKTFFTLTTTTATAAVAAMTTAVTLTASTPQKAYALEQCRPKARNCIRTAWEAPPSSIKNKEDAINVIKNVLNSYPQNGQNGVDCNGWSIVKDIDTTTTTTSSSPSSDKSIIALEYKSCIGPAALAINLAQPFIDDVILEFEERKLENDVMVVIVQVKSSSRMGSSDLNVNKKRIEYLGEKLRQQGWIIPNVRYGA